MCTGNLYRSPLAERLLVEQLGPFGRGIRVISAGTAARAVPIRLAALPTEPATDSRGRVPRRLTVDLVEGSDLVLGAATKHREAAVRMSPAWALRRAFTLREFARLVRPQDAEGTTCPVERFTVIAQAAAARRGARCAPADDDVADPQGASSQVAQTSAALVEEAVERIVRAVLG
ncbi:low molecular weight phosphatase family protein [Streptacidiphilus sp. EB129]|uniref:arsenate reductase/protein-tyrosine-phosphatase family protein n=1 Tax=Streptacidiphilus sp. EB129 TaxID=3156262 RepID=UPI003517A27F